ncbi:MAG: CDGSH iron-sulfur domain-containing protein [Candidatus Nanopelagicales bacterium]
MSDPVILTPLPDGPNEVSGLTVVKDADGNVLKEGEKTYLCRCGFSANKPFCDGAHKREGWTSN